MIDVVGQLALGDFNPFALYIIGNTIITPVYSIIHIISLLFFYVRIMEAFRVLNSLSDVIIIRFLCKRRLV